MSEGFKHCCAHMDRYTVTTDEDFIIEYMPDIRSYNFLIYKNGKYIGINQRLWYCPWCGKKLPNELSEEMEEILEKEYGITAKDWDSPSWNDDTDLPHEFKTEEWWKKRGL
ncbi:MAG: hypothetical protein Tsb006_7290 [Rickettsiaceae bacterium]